MRKGGYSILDLTSASVYDDAYKVVDCGKPIMVYDDNDVYYADTIVLDGTNVVITKGGKTITIANDNTITNVGDIQLKVFGLYVGYSSDDVADRLVTIDNVDVTIDDENFDESESIVGLYKLISSLKIDIQYKFFNDDNDIVLININKNGNINMYVDDVKVLDCKVNNDDTITYTISNGYFYISHYQLI